MEKKIEFKSLEQKRRPMVRWAAAKLIDRQRSSGLPQNLCLEEGHDQRLTESCTERSEAWQRFVGTQPTTHWKWATHELTYFLPRLALLGYKIVSY